mmetsp:Transcript_28821/g.52702  ORF Transcript_28821/g.52702 Transcript_28821/m.52702 type:complete len:218 (-) Transcript_28821:943-1596(-)
MMIQRCRHRRQHFHQVHSVVVEPVLLIPSNEPRRGNTSPMSKTSRPETKHDRFASPAAWLPATWRVPFDTVPCTTKLLPQLPTPRHGADPWNTVLRGRGIPTMAGGCARRCCWRMSMPPPRRLGPVARGAIPGETSANVDLPTSTHGVRTPSLCRILHVGGRGVSTGRGTRATLPRRAMQCRRRHHWRKGMRRNWRAVCASLGRWKGRRIVQPIRGG